MTLKQRLENDIKAALLGGDRFAAEVLRGLKSVILYEEVALKRREDGLNDDEIELLFAKEVKKRDESAELFERGGNQQAADKERAEKKIILGYLPEPLSEQELREKLAAIITEKKAQGPQQMGMVLGALKSEYGSRVNGALAAKIAKELLS
ncbi:MAG TPA: GatB/YqeY domain-containing protein [Candidatus Saccharimonadales bacterium]